MLNRELLMNNAAPPVALLFSKCFVKILKRVLVNDGDFESVKNVSCNPTTAGLYHHANSHLHKIRMKTSHVLLNNGMSHYFSLKNR